MLKYALLSIAAAFAVSVSLRLSQMLWSPFAIVLRFMSLIVMLGMALLAYVFLQVATDEGYVGGYVLAGLLAFLCLSILGRLIQTRTSIKSPTSAKKMPKPTPKQPEVPQHHNEWSIVEGRLGWRERRRVRHARQAIDAFLAEGQSPSLSYDHEQLALSLRTRVPELLREFLSRCERGSRSECYRYAEQFCETIEKLARAAARARSEIREMDDHKLNVFHRYFSQVAEPRA